MKININIKLLCVFLMIDCVIGQHISKWKCNEMSSLRTDPRSLQPHLLDIINTRNRSSHCFGTLISEDFVFTSKECVTKLLFGITKKSLRVFKYKLRTDQYPDSQLFTVKRLIFCEFWEECDTNIALIQLNENVPYHEDLSIFRPACLWADNVLPTTIHYKIGPQTQKISRNLLTDGECSDYLQYYGTYNNSLYMCVNSTDYEFDSAWIMTVEGKFQKQSYVFGTVVRVIRKVFVVRRITNFILWIESIVWPNSCGQQHVKSKSLVAYDLPTNHGEYPWHVALYRIDGGRQNRLIYICGGTIINYVTILTTADCVHDENGVLSANRLMIVVGTNDLNQYNNDIQNYIAKTITVHEKFTIDHLKNDIAIVKLNRPIKYSSYIQPICISTSSYFINMTFGTVTGWGRDQLNQPSDILLQSTLPILTNDVCNRSNPNFFQNYSNENNYCAGYPDATTYAVSGDKGGAMIFEHNGRWYIRGIVSATPTLEAVQLFTDVPKFYKWIINN